VTQVNRCSLRREAPGRPFAVHYLDEAHTEILAAAGCGLACDSDRPEILVDLANVAAVSSQALVALVKLRRKLFAAGVLLILSNLQPARRAGSPCSSTGTGRRG
jgi:hypothetical protein